MEESVAQKVSLPPVAACSHEGEADEAQPPSLKRLPPLVRCHLVLPLLCHFAMLPPMPPPPRRAAAAAAAPAVATAAQEDGAQEGPPKKRPRRKGREPALEAQCDADGEEELRTEQDDNDEPGRTDTASAGGGQKSTGALVLTQLLCCPLGM